MIIEIFISTFFIYIVFPQKQLIGLVSGQLNCCILQVKQNRYGMNLYIEAPTRGVLPSRPATLLKRYYNTGFFL